jgi:hypothetical protein
MRGSVVKRGKTWSYVVDVGRDPVSGRRRQRWKGGFATKREAEQALARALTGGVADAGSLTVGAYFDQWLAGHALLVRFRELAQPPLEQWWRTSRMRSSTYEAEHIPANWLLTNAADHKAPLFTRRAGAA